jgi:SAM-dependent methyltransferase
MTAKGIALWIIKRTPVLDRAILPSAGYRILTREQAAAFAHGARGWFTANSAVRQQKAYVKLLSTLREGMPRLDFRVASQAVDAAGLTHATLLDVGCGNGYYSEVFARLAKTVISYTGGDYSPAMVESAKRHYPGTDFQVADATQLPFAENSFEITFNGVSLMHILDYGSAIREAARVARSYAVFHCVPVFEDHKTVYFSKYAYGAPVLEIAFSEIELLQIFTETGLELVGSWDSLEYDLHHLVGAHSRKRTYLCRKQKPGEVA